MTPIDKVIFWGAIILILVIIRVAVALIRIIIEESKMKHFLGLVIAGVYMLQTCAYNLWKG